MKKFYLKIALLLFAFTSMGQGKVISATDLSNYCPQSRSQFKTTCYAYAVVYTAMSTEFNIQNNITDPTVINNDYFSSGIIASYHNSSLPFYRRSPNCGKSGTADGSLEILKTHGTTFSKLYDCDCKSFDKIKKELKPTDRLYKIGGYETLEINNQYTDSSVDWIKNAIDNRHPVIIAVYQNDRLHDIDTKDITDSLPDEETMSEISKNLKYGISNHVICILGYDDKYLNRKGHFLLKNNFDGWGNGSGFSWVPYTFILPLIHEAYFIKGVL